MIRFTSLLRILILSIAVWLPVAPAQAEVHWTKLARQVGQNEKNHALVIRRLRETKNLEQTLLKALETPQRSLALDVISALRMETMIPELLDRVAADEDGFLVLTLNSLLSQETKSRILDSYVENLNPGRPQIYSAAAIVAMMEPLSRLGVPLSKEILNTLFAHEYPEVKSAALEHVRLQILRYGKKENSDLIMKALKMNPAQIRVQAIFLIDELASKPELAKSISSSSVEEACNSEKNASLKKKCMGIAQKLKGGT